MPWGLVPGLPALESLLGTGFNLGFRRRYCRRPVFAAPDLVGQFHAIRHRRLVGGFGQCHQLLYFRFQLRLNLLGVCMGQRAVSAGIGVNLGAVQADGAKALPEGNRGIVIRMTVAGDMPERQRAVGRPFNRDFPLAPDQGE